MPLVRRASDPATTQRALRSFHEDYPEARVYLLYLGRERLDIDGIPCVPCDDFLRGLHPDRVDPP